jgi:hypothetical protein
MECVYRERTKKVGEKYDEHVLIPLLMKVFKHLNPKSKTSLTFLASSMMTPCGELEHPLRKAIFF